LAKFFEDPPMTRLSLATFQERQKGSRIAGEGDRRPQSPNQTCAMYASLAPSSSQI
jgi:hypothetical protein